MLFQYLYFFIISLFWSFFGQLPASPKIFNALTKKLHKIELMNHLITTYNHQTIISKGSYILQNVIRKIYNALFKQN